MSRGENYFRIQVENDRLMEVILMGDSEAVEKDL
jgi:hypothetical protein